MTQQKTEMTTKWENFLRRLGLRKRPAFLIVGLEKTGMSVCSFLSQFDCSLIVTDKSDTPLLRQKLSSIRRVNIETVLGEHREESFSKADCIVVSPGVPLTLSYFTEPRSRQVPIINDIELSYHFYEGPLVGITGSNGKTTVSDLTGKILSTFPNGSTVAGNIGLPVLDSVPFERPDNHVVVLEISSFQLESVIHFRPFIGVLLNLTPDHLDRYSDSEAYYQAKMRLFRNQIESDWALLNYDDPQVKKHARQIKAGKFWFSRSRPESPGLWYDHDWIMTDYKGREERLFSVENMRLVGHHNRLNVLAAVGSGLLLERQSADMSDIVTHYPGMPHRFELVTTYKDRIFINDSKATNIGAVMAALNGYRGKVHLILGGRNKGGDFSELKPLILDKVSKIYLIGEARHQIAEMLLNTREMFLCETLGSAVWKAYRQSGPGETILLSPGCASFDMFQNFEDRGNSFREIVRHLVESENGSAQSVPV